MTCQYCVKGVFREFIWKVSCPPFYVLCRKWALFHVYIIACHSDGVTVEQPVTSQLEVCSLLC